MISTEVGMEWDWKKTRESNTNRVQQSRGVWEWIFYLFTTQRSLRLRRCSRRLWSPPLGSPPSVLSSHSCSRRTGVAPSGDTARTRDATTNNGCRSASGAAGLADITARRAPSTERLYRSTRHTSSKTRTISAEYNTLARQVGNV